MESKLGPFSLRLEAFSNYVILGGTGSGKTSTTIDIIKNRNSVFTEKVDRVIYYTLSLNQEIFEQIKDDDDVMFVQNVSDFEAALNLGHSHALVCFDDLMIQAMEGLNSYICDYFCVKSHHIRSTTIFHSQSMFPKRLRIMMTNTQYFILKKTPFVSQLSYFFRQLDSKRWRSLVDIYSRVLSEAPYNLLLISVHARTNPKLFIRDFVVPRRGGRVFVLNN